MAWIFLDAAAQSTCASPISNVQLTIVLASTAAFGAPAAGDKVPLVILDAGNVAWSPANPLATPYEYVDETANVPGTNTITVTRAQGGTTAKTFSAGAIVAAVPQSRMFAAGGAGAFARIDGANLTPNLGLGRLKLQEQSGALVSYVFSAIPSGYRALHLRYKLRDTSAVNGFTYAALQFDGDNGAHYDSVERRTVGVATTAAEVLAATAGSLALMAGGGLANVNVHGQGFIDIEAYADANNDKMAEGHGSLSTGTNLTGTFYLEEFIAHWRNQAAIASIAMFPVSAGTFSAGSWAALYGDP